MAIVGIALLILISGTVIFLDYSKKSNDQVISNQLNIIGSSIMSNAESMYVLGNESWVTIEFNFPRNVNAAAINNNQEMYFMYSTSSGTSYAVFFSDKFNISSGSPTCQDSCILDFEPGLNKIRIKSTGKVVNIYKVS
ncbi:MAG: hypothetical protein ACP5N2_05660 [Candidatus Nanoarchaeia archaeon]